VPVRDGVKGRQVVSHLDFHHLAPCRIPWRAFISFRDGDSLESFAHTFLYKNGQFVPHILAFLMACSFCETAWRTLQGYEMMNMMRKGQLQGVAKEEVRDQMVLVAKLFGVAA